MLSDFIFWIKKFTGCQCIEISEDNAFPLSHFFCLSCFLYKGTALCPQPSWNGSRFLCCHRQIVWSWPGSQTDRATCNLSAMNFIHSGGWTLWPSGSGSRYQSFCLSKSPYWQCYRRCQRAGSALSPGHHIWRLCLSTGFISQEALRSAGAGSLRR